MPALSSTSSRSAAAEKKIKARKIVKQPGPISDAENRKINSYKRTRPYYRANVAALQHRPAVERLNKRARTGSHSEAARKKMARQYSEQARRGPDKIAASAYRHYVRELWKDAKRYYPGSDKTPKVKIGYHGDPTNLAWVYHGQNTVYYSPAAIRGFMGPDRYSNKKSNRNRDQARGVPLHEFTHTRQSDKTALSKAATEGGAEAKAERVANKLRMPYVPASPYRKYAKRAKRHPRFVRYGQFK